MVKDCEKKNKENAQQDKITQKKTYPKRGTCGKTNHPEARCWQGVGAHLKSKSTRPEASSDSNPASKVQKPQYNTTSIRSQFSSEQDDSKN